MAFATSLCASCPVFSVCVAIGCILLTSGLIHFRHSQRRSCNPVRPPSKDPTQNGFSRKKIPDHVDFIIIGSGLSGLYLASLLSRIGFTVVVLEQHYVAGGCTHVFTEHGFEFDTGVHYIGQAGVLASLLDFVTGRKSSVRFHRLGSSDGSEVYNEVHVGKEVYLHRPGPVSFRNDLMMRFPDDRVAILRFLSEVDKAQGAFVVTAMRMFLPTWVHSYLVRKVLRCFVEKFVHRSLGEVLTDCGITNPLLRAVLVAEFGDYGTLPDDTPFFVHAVILAHYFKEGGFYPVGGPSRIAEGLVPGIAERGAVLVRAPVERIIIENGRAVGVEVAGKGVVRAAKGVVSAAGVSATRKLLPGWKATSVVAKQDHECDMLSAFVGLDGSAQELGLPDRNIWDFSVVEDPLQFDAVFKKLTDGDNPPAFLTNLEVAEKTRLPCFITNSSRDPDHERRHPGKATICCAAFSNREFLPCLDGKRGADYSRFKECVLAAVRHTLVCRFPHLEDKIAHMEVGTPLTYQTYLGRSSAYGIGAGPERVLQPLNEEFKIQRLYLTGQDTLMCGVFPQPFAAWLAFANIVGFFSLDFATVLFDFVRFQVARAFDKSLPSYKPTRP